MTNTHGSGTPYSAFPERRLNPFRPELRDAGEGGGPKHIWGYASMFNKLSRKLPGGFVERVDTRAFDVSKANGFDGAVCRWNHNPDFILGSIAGRTCTIDTNGTGLLYDVIPPSFRSDIIELMERGDVVGSSFAFRTPESWEGDDWQLSDFGIPLRTLLEVELVDVAPCSSTPAYPDATAALRSVEGAVASLAHKFDASPEEIRTLLSDNKAARLFKRSDVSLRSEEEARKDYSKDDRDKMAAAGTAMKDGSYPIADEEDLHNAIKLAGNGKGDPAAIKAHIRKRAKALDKSDAIPADWDGEKKSEDAVSEERAAKASYKDLETCGECGSGNQFGKHCTDCGKPMSPDMPSKGAYCADCGGKMPAKRSEHTCDVEERADSKPPKGDKDDDEDEEDPESTGDAPEEDSVTEDAETRDSEAEDIARKAEYRKMQMELLAKRSDPYEDQD